jgi:membrane protease YdiL (CAAX protease family)
MSAAAAFAASSAWTFVALLLGGLLGVGLSRALGLAADSLAAYVAGVSASFVGFVVAAFGASRALGGRAGARGGSEDGGFQGGGSEAGGFQGGGSEGDGFSAAAAPAPGTAARALRLVTTAGAALCLSSALEQALAVLDLGPIPFVEEVTAAVAAIDFPARLALVLPFAVCPALGEELFFRHVLWRRLGPASPRVRAGVTSLLFGLAHVDPRHVAAAAALGVFLAAVRARGDGFARCLAAHFTANAAFVLSAGMGSPERPGLALVVAAAAFALLAARALRDPIVDAPS